VEKPAYPEPPKAANVVT